jgi:hypothetical protein
VGREAPRDTNDAPHVIPRAVPLSSIRIIRLCPLVGVPDRFDVIDVIASASAVMVNISVVSVFMVGVAEEATVLDRFVTRLLVRVSVPARVARVPVVGSVIPVVAVAVRVMAYAPEVINDPVSAMVRVADVVGAVIVTLFMDVAVATPNTGVTRVGEFDRTILVVPVDVVTPVPPFATGRVPVTWVVSETCCHADVPVPVPTITVVEVGVDAPVPTFVSMAIIEEFWSVCACAREGLLRGEVAVGLVNESRSVG